MDLIEEKSSLLILQRFTLLPYCYLVKGAKRGAIYNLKTGHVYSIDEKSVSLLERLEKGIALNNVLSDIPGLNSEESLSYLRNLEILGLGRFVLENKETIKISFQRPIENLHFIWLEVTTSCNLKCIHCYTNSNRIKPLKETMTEKDWKRVMEESYALGCRRLQFIGGEPFCIGNNKLLRLIQQAKDIGYDFIEVYTNCTMMKKKALEFFCKNKISVATSLYGSNAEIHDLITQQPGSFNKTIGVIREIIRYKLSLRIGIIEMKQNTDNIKKTVSFLQRMGVKRIKIDIVRPSGRGCSQDLLDLNLINKQKRKAPFFSKCNFVAFQKAHYSHNCFSEKICITANGNILPCIMERDLVLGNILKTSLSKIIYSEKSRKIRSITKSDIEICKDCEYRYCCFDCRVKARNFPGAENFYAKPSNCLYNPYKGEWAETKVR
jgi:radical SAM protein with 4Fe4S-binding SPASM domain